MTFFVITADPLLHRSDRSSVPGMDIANPFIKVVHVGMLMKWDVISLPKVTLTYIFGLGPVRAVRREMLSVYCLRPYIPSAFWLLVRNYYTT